MRFGSLASLALGLILSGLMPVISMAQTGLSVGSGQGEPGQSVELPIQLHGTPEALQFELSFDGDRVDLLEVIAEGDFLIDYAWVGAGRVRIVAWTEQCPDPRGGATSLVSVNFSIAAAAPPGVVDIVPDNALLADSDGQAISPVSLSAGVITILGTGDDDEELSEPHPVPGPSLIALVLLALLVSLTAPLVVRKRPGLLLVVMVVGVAGLVTTDAGSDAGMPGEAGDLPDFQAKVDVILDRQPYTAALDCNDDGVIDVRDLVCARNEFCSETPNQPPVMQPIADQTLEAGETLELQVIANDPDPDDTLTFGLDVAPAGMTINADTGLITWTTTIDDVGMHPVTAVVSDEGGLSDSQSFEVTVTEPAPENRPPSLEAIADRTLLVGQVLSIQPVATDPDLPDDVLTFSLEGQPAGLSLATSSGGMTWAPVSDQVGQWPMTLTVTDAGGMSDSASFVVTVNAIGSPPTIEAIPNQTLLIGELLDITAQASDSDLPDDELTFALTRAPQGMAINPSTGRITWTPGAERLGAHDVTVRVTDQIGLQDVTRFVVQVIQPNRAPVALDDEYRVSRGETLSVPAPGVMENDFDPDGDPITAELVTDPIRGQLDFRADGSFDYTPGLDFPPVRTEPVADLQWLELDGQDRRISLDGIARFVIADLTGDGRSELISTISRDDSAGNWQGLLAARYTEEQELEPLWFFRDPDQNGGEFSMSAPTTFRDGVAVGDVTGDGFPNIVVNGRCGGSILVFSHIGEPLFSSQADIVGGPECNAGGRSGAPNLVDLTGDGVAEIVNGWRNELNAWQRVDGDDGPEWVLLWQSATATTGGGGNFGHHITIADINLDGSPNIWFRGVMFNADGTVLWAPPLSSPGSFMSDSAIANLNDDPYGELIFFHNSNSTGVVAVDHEGQCLWQAKNPGSPPSSQLNCPLVYDSPNNCTLMNLAVADIAGDGVSRVLLGSNCYQSSHENWVVARNPDGSLFWQTEALLPDGRSLRLEDVTAFDFNGDGSMEVVAVGYNGTLVLDGRDGNILWSMSDEEGHPGTPGSDSSRHRITVRVADLSGDGSAELILGSSSWWYWGRDVPAGLFVYRDPEHSWMPARGIWNQVDYSVTNVNPDLSIPSPSRPNWLDPGLNNYKVNAIPVDERVGAVQVASFRNMVIDGSSALWRVNGGSVVAGDLTGDGRSELLAIGQRGSGIANTQYLTALSFNEDNELEPLWFWNGWLSAAPDRDFAMRNARDPVIGDITGDGLPEVIVGGYCRGDILIFSNLGEPLISTQAGRVPQPGEGESTPDCPFTGSGNVADAGRISLVDLSGNGLPEILYGFKNIMRAFDNQGNLLWETEIPDFSPGGFPYDHAVADVNLDGRPNIFFGGALLDADGNILWSKATNPLSSDWIGAYAVANLNDDPFAELIYWGNGPDLIVFDHHGNCLWQARRSSSTNPTPSLGCPSAMQIPDLATTGFRTDMIVADITGDGRPRIVIGHLTINDSQPSNRVIAFNADGTPFWSVPALLSSGASVWVNQINAFDLTGNGVMELVVTGVNGTVVLDGRNGSTLWEIPADENNPGFGNSTGANMLYSIIVDLDGDGAAELVVSSQGSAGLDGQTPTGLFVYRDPQNRWMPARGVWNQWAYSVTNINEDLSIPSPAERNWLTRGLNNHRVNAFMPGESGALDTFSYRVGDGELFSNDATVYLDIRRPNRPPMFITSPVRLAAIGFDYQYRVIVVDPDPGDEATVSLNQGPAGMVLGADQVLRWKPGAADLGEHPVILSAIDLEGEISTQEFVIEVVEPSAVPDVIGLSQADAEQALDAAGFRSGRITERFDEEIDTGLVAGQQPGGGSLQVPGAAVDLQVSLGPAPIDDSIPPEFPVEAIRIEPDTLNLLAGEVVSLKAYAEFADGSTQLITRAVAWSSDSAAASVNADGRLTAIAGGMAVISAEYDGVVGQAGVQVIALDPDDDEGPSALITSPTEGEVLLGRTEVIGIAFDDNLVRYELALSPAGEGLWTLLSEGTGNVDDDVLGTFDPTVLLNGFYDIRLRVLDAGGNESTDLVTVQTDGEQKVGLFTLAFNDLTVPLGGLPIQIERVYDSRDRSMGDFGMGWRLGLRSIELTCSSNLGEDWFVAQGGLSFSLLPMREKACAISLPGGRMEVFDFVVSPSNSPFVPFVTVTGQLQPRPGTLGKIEILDNTNFLILDQQPGEVWLYDDVTFNPFNPVNLRYTMPDGTVFEFTDGKVTRVTDTNGNSLAFTLDGIEHSSGIGVDFERDSLGRITAITDPSGQTQHYAYSANGDLMSHTDALAHVTRFFYNTRHGLLRIEDPLGNSAIRSEYDERGRLIALIDAAGNRTEHDYDDEARLKTTTFPDGSTRVVAYDERGNIESRTRLVTIDGVPVFSEETWEYDEAGNPTRIVDADGIVQESEWNDDREWTRRVIDPGGLELVEEQEFDLGGLLARSVDALGRERHYRYDNSNNVTFSPGPGGMDFSLSYESGGRLESLGDPRGDLTRLEYNSAGQVIARETRSPEGLVLTRTEFELDANGRIISQTEVGLADGEASRTTILIRDAMGRVISATNPLGEITGFEYDAIGNVTAMIDPLGARTEMEYDDRGLMVERRLPDGGVETFDFDHAGRQILHVDPDGVARATEYDELGRVVAELVDGQLMARRVYSPGGRLVAEVDALGNRTDYEYDSAGRMIRSVLPEVFDALSGSPQRPEVLMEYNALGQRTAMVDPLGRRTEYVYDDAGYLSRVIHPDGSEREHEFDAAGRHLSVTDEEGYSTLFDYDAAGRLIQVLQPSPAPGEPRPETLYFYDSFGQLRSRVDALGRVTAFEYDAAGRRTRKIMPDGTAREFEYDAAGRQSRIIDFDGAELLFSHDALGRLLSRSGPGVVELISYTAAGRRATVSDSRGLTVFDHDDHGRLAGFVEGDGLGIDYAYDARGQLVSLTVDGQTTEYAWDAVGRLASVTTDEGTVSYAYDLAGQLVSKSLPNGVVREVEYDLRGRPLEVSLRDPADTLIEQFVSTYSPRGKRLSVTTSDGTVETYDYDPIGRLIEAERTGSDPFALAFEYDPVGNRLRQVMDGVETLYSYGPNHELIAVGPDSFEYDLRGNRIAAVIKGQAIDYQWDAFGRLTGVNTPDGQAAFQYDVDDRRVARVIDGDRIRQLIDPRNVSGFAQVVAEYTDTGQIEARWHYGRQLLAQQRQAQTHHYGLDHRGSVALLTDDAGQVTDRYGYLPFGDLNAASGATPNPYRFNAERYEPAARAYDLRQRSYDACTGTFVSRDPFPGFQDRPFSLHPYQFGDADPVNHIDPLGLFTLPEISIAQVIQGGMRLANFISKARVVCKATTPIKVVNAITAAGQIAAFSLNVASGKADFKTGITVPLSTDPGGPKFKLEINPDFGFSNPAERSFEIKASVEEDGRSTPAMGVKITPNAIIPSGGIGKSFTLVEIAACGLTVATLDLNAELTAEVGVSLSGLSGKTTFKAQLALGFKNAAFGFFDSGGLEWTFIEISRASNEPPVNRFFEP